MQEVWCPEHGWTTADAWSNELACGCVDLDADYETADYEWENGL
jgi:hypothetical protein